MENIPQTDQHTIVLMENSYELQNLSLDLMENSSELQNSFELQNSSELQNTSLDLMEISSELQNSFELQNSSKLQNTSLDLMETSSELQNSFELQNSSLDLMEVSFTMSALDFPPELNAMMMKKLRLADLLQLYNARSEFADFRYEKSLQNSMGFISLKELCRVYADCVTDSQRSQCFHPQVKERLKMESLKEINDLYKRRENKHFFSHENILEFLNVKKIPIDEEKDFNFAKCCIIATGISIIVIYLLISYIIVINRKPLPIN